MNGATQQTGSSSSPSSSSATKLDLGKLQNELKCCICLSLFEETKQLQCGHVCCEACVMGLVGTDNADILFGLPFLAQDNTIACPLCREESLVPADGKLPTAFVVKSLVTHIKAAAGADSPADPANNGQKVFNGQCSACKEPAPFEQLFFCTSCLGFNCPLCACELHGEHKLVKASKAHETLMNVGKPTFPNNASSQKQNKSSEFKRRLEQPYGRQIQNTASFNAHWNVARQVAVPQIQSRIVLQQQPCQVQQWGPRQPTYFGTVPLANQRSAPAINVPTSQRQYFAQPAGYSRNTGMHGHGHGQPMNQPGENQLIGTRQQQQNYYYCSRR